MSTCIGDSRKPQPEQLSQPFRLRPVYGNFTLLFVVHTELVAALEPGTTSLMPLIASKMSRRCVSMSLKGKNRLVIGFRPNRLPQPFRRGQIDVDAENAGKKALQAPYRDQCKPFRLIEIGQ